MRLSDSHRTKAIQKLDVIPSVKREAKIRKTILGGVYVLAGLGLAGAGIGYVFLHESHALDKWVVIVVVMGVGLSLYGSHIMSEEASDAGRAFLMGFVKDVFGSVFKKKP